MSPEPDIAAELAKTRAELDAVNRELEETNRGVVALYAELDDRAQEVQKAVALKTRFLSNITHEFRTPLHSIVGISRMLLEHLDGDLTPEQEKQARFINQAARDLTELVNDLLDLAKSDAGKAEIALAPVSVHELFATLRGMSRPFLEANPGVALVFTGPDAAIVTDERKLSQILRNLVYNALKYTVEGEVRVGAWVEADHVRFVIADTGIGISPEHHEKVFEEFYQVQNPLQHKSRGTGLGLALTRRLVTVLGGVITLQSAVGRGSTFTVTLPLQSTEAAPA